MDNSTKLLANPVADQSQLSIVERKVVAQRNTIHSLLKANRRLKLRIAGLERQMKAAGTIPVEDLSYALRMAAAQLGAIVEVDS